MELVTPHHTFRVFATTYDYNADCALNATRVAGGTGAVPVKLVTSAKFVELVEHLSPDSI